MLSEPKTLIDSYIAWLKDNTNMNTISNDLTEITTPFLDHYNDHIQLYLEKINNEFILSDDGYTIHNLEMGGVKFETSSKRSDILRATLNRFGVLIRNNELSVKIDEKSFPQKKHMLLQAILAVNDMFYLAREHTRSLFHEDVVNWLSQNDVRFIPNMQILGKTGYTHSFEVAIPSSKNVQERLLKTINAPSKTNIMSVIMAFLDAKEFRDFTPCAFLNDTERIDDKNIEPLRAYGVNTFFWSERDRHLDFLAA